VCGSDGAPYRAAFRCWRWAASNFAEFESLVYASGACPPAPGERPAGWLRRITGRLAANLVYAHQVRDVQHVKDCGDRACAPGCGWLAVEKWLDQPLAWWEVEQDEAFAERTAALLRGEIPA
jgi:hypothetical protein